MPGAPETPAMKKSALPRPLMWQDEQDRPIRAAAPPRRAGDSKAMRPRVSFRLWSSGILVGGVSQATGAIVSAFTASA